MSNVDHLHIPAFSVFLPLENIRFNISFRTQTRKTTSSRQFYYMDLKNYVTLDILSVLAEHLTTSRAQKIIFSPHLAFTLGHPLLTMHVCIRSRIWRILKLDIRDFY